MKNARLVVDGKFPGKSVICLLEKNNRFSALKTRWSEEGLEAFPRVLGEYTVRQDTVAPVILYMGKVGLKTDSGMVDDIVGHLFLSGCGEREGCLFTYDAKICLLEGNIRTRFRERKKQACLEGGGCREKYCYL